MTDIEIAVVVIHYILAAVMIAVAVTWVWLIRTMQRTLAKTPLLDEFQAADHTSPKVSVILPARNEEKYLEGCLDSLLSQDYANYEIVVVDDSSQDRTGQIIQNYAKKDPRVIHVAARPKPDDWMGKSWACSEGYRKASGTLLLLTDADTKHSSNAVSLAVAHLLSAGLDALTAGPRILCFDFWTRIVLPVISTFLHTQFSALRANDPSNKFGYFFGSFFIIKRETYDAVGTHEAVRHEIIEDGALGAMVKQSGHKMKVVRGDHLIDAVWARDASTLWNAIKRTMVPVYRQSRSAAMGITAATTFLFFMPLLLLAYSALHTASGYAGADSGVLLWASLAALLLVYTAGIIECRAMQVGIRYAVLIPLGGLVMTLGFLSGLIHAKSDTAVSWRNRDYAMKDRFRSPAAT